MFRKLFWKIRFRAHLGRILGIYGDELTSCCNAEIENYFDKDDSWKDYAPLDAVQENLSYWGE